MATPEQMQQVATAVTELTTRLEQQAQTLNTVQAQNVQLANRLQSRESEVEELKGALRRQGPQSSSSQGDGHRDSIVQKWAPDMLTGERTAWQDWAYAKDLDWDAMRLCDKNTTRRMILVLSVATQAWAS